MLNSIEDSNKASNICDVIRSAGVTCGNQSQKGCMR